MLSLRQIVLVGAAFCLGTIGLFAQTQKEDGLAKQIAGLPWETENVLMDYSVNDDSRVVIVAHFTNTEVVAATDVVTDTDTGYVIFHPKNWILDENGRRTEMREMFGWGHGAGRGDSGGNSSSGCGDFENVKKDGFDYHLNLTWKIYGQSEKKFDQTFHCLWVKEQTFKKNGFTVTLTVKLKGMELLRPSASSK